MWKKYIHMFAFVMITALMFGLGNLSVLAETVSENQISEEQQVQGTELYEETEFSLSGYCGRESENDGKNVAYTISDSNNDGIYDLIEIKGNGVVCINKCPSHSDDNKLKVTKIVIEEGVTHIDNGRGFSYFDSLKEVVLPKGITMIPMYLFMDCSSLNRVVLPEGLECIQPYAFVNCSSLSEITIPEGVKDIQENTFSGCTSLTKVELPDSLELIIYSSFRGCSSLKEIVVPYNAYIADTESDPAFFGCDSLVKIFLPHNCIGYSKLPNITSKIGYMFNADGDITITDIELGEGQTLIEIPDAIKGKSIVYVTEELRYMVSESGHTHRYDNGVCKICDMICPHNNVTEHKQVEASCVENGTCDYWYCNDCKKYFRDKTCVTEVSYEDIVIQATGHIGGRPTCSSKAVCSICGIEYGDFVEHNYINGICSYCGRRLPDYIPIGPDTWKDKEGIDAFVYRLYNIALIRDGEKEGLEDWIDRLDTKKESAAEVAWGFFFSDEFLNKNYTDEQYIELLYLTMFGRESDGAGKRYWLECLENGVSREYIYRGFAESPEFTGLCGDFGIERGFVDLNQYRDQNIEATGFIARLYTQMLGRSFDDDGIEYWCQEYLGEDSSIEEIAADGFLHSKEFKNQNLSNREFVIRMYRTFLNREPDEEGLADWVNRLETGRETRDSLVYGFTRSKEFGNFKEAYGL